MATQPSTIVEDEKEEEQLLASCSVTVNSDHGDPRTMQEAIQGSNAKAWREGLYRVYDNFIKCTAWMPEKLPEERKLL
jgi:hypothetical protein